LYELFGVQLAVAVFLYSDHELSGLKLDPEVMRVAVWSLLEIDKSSGLVVFIPDVEADEREGGFDVFDGHSERGRSVGLVCEKMDCLRAER